MVPPLDPPSEGHGRTVTWAKTRAYYTDREFELMSRLRSTGLPEHELRILHEIKALGADMRSGTPTHIYTWGNNPRRAELRGRPCLIITAGGTMRTVLIEFTDNGERVTTSSRAIKRI